MKIKNIKKNIKSPFIKGDVRRTGGFKAFTFIELIVVVTIIAVISVVGAVSYSSANKKSRDARRISDLEKMRISLEMMRQVGVTYPASANNLVPTYLQSLPLDPKSNAVYWYTAGTNNYTYTLRATMEDLGATNGSYGSGYNYQVTNP